MPLIYIGTTSSQDYLAHHGILGQKWGVRRFQNPDGSLTPEGRERYSSAKEQKQFADKLAKVKYDDSNSYMQVVKTPQMKSAIKAVKAPVARYDQLEAALRKKESEFYNSKEYEKYATEAAVNDFRRGVKAGWWDNSKDTLDRIIWQYLYDDGDQGDVIELFKQSGSKLAKELVDLENKTHEAWNEALDVSKAYVKEFIGEYGDQYVSTAANIARTEASPEDRKRQRQAFADIATTKKYLNNRSFWY